MPTYYFRNHISLIHLFVVCNTWGITPILAVEELSVDGSCDGRGGTRDSWIQTEVEVSHWRTIMNIFFFLKIRLTDQLFIDFRQFWWGYYSARFCCSPAFFPCILLELRQCLIPLFFLAKGFISKNVKCY